MDVGRTMTGTVSSALPTVTARIPAYNGASFISEALTTVLHQTYPNLRVLVSDDASTDETLQICERFTAQDLRVTVVHQPRNLGWTGNTNALLDRVESEYLFFPNHDDLLDPEYVSKLVERLESTPEALLAFSDVQLAFPNGSLLKRALEEIDGLEDGFERALRIVRRQKNWFVVDTGLFRSSVVKAIGGPRRHLAGEIAADWPWVLRLALRGQFVRVPEVLYTSRRTLGSLSRQWKRNRVTFAAVVVSCGREIHESTLPLTKRIRLYYELMRVWLRGMESFIWRSKSQKLREQAIRAIERYIDETGRLVLIDLDLWAIDKEVGCTALPFLEADGAYWGLPKSDKAAVEELDRMRANGAGYLAIAWPAFWWFEEYRGFCRHLDSHYRRISTSKSVVIYEL